MRAATTRLRAAEVANAKVQADAAAVVMSTNPVAETKRVGVPGVCHLRDHVRDIVVAQPDFV